jgi:hypothetical protein
VAVRLEGADFLVLEQNPEKLLHLSTLFIKIPNKDGFGSGF